MRKIVTIVGTRPEIIKLSAVISELDKHCEHILVHSGQNYDYELNQVFFDDLGIRKPDYFLEAAGANAAITIANIITKSDEVFEKLKPDAILLYGDTNSCLSVISAKKRKIPIFHMEAGNRCFDQRVPEEVNRKIIDHLSDINMTLTEHARRYLIQEGLPAERILKVGSSMKEVLMNNQMAIDNSTILKSLDLEEKEYFVVSIHREENVDNPINFSHFLNSLNQLVNEFGKKIIVSTHPRTRKKLAEYKDVRLDDKVTFLKPLGFFDYISLQKNAFCTISDSGTITEESSILGFPAVTIRDAHERPEGMDEGTLIMCGLESENIVNAIKIVSSGQCDNFPKIVDDYNGDYISKKVVRIIHSYIDYVNRVVWSK
ncbi:putative LPS biosynthesis related epimerase [Lentisphaera araneosa HTCC2155]|uniref:Putative LPS biosynthesis related epimerase n=1 Tax=Lentisphaera araneosa HTCC2155 TaxID=313628 RepID=A6DT11_9BACT|nr:UDP-N-acetylglucosamine 2-epimerase (non-hydrolyzing) [Lentisphaera araneosa]EDM25186.1 putative LPS biosynthesis related epimerase [Lentisphaera araneosa HTCC2155]